MAEGRRCHMAKRHHRFLDKATRRLQSAGEKLDKKERHAYEVEVVMSHAQICQKQKKGARKARIENIAKEGCWLREGYT